MEEKSLKREYILFVKEKAGLCLKAICSFLKDNWGVVVPLLYGCLLLAIHKFVIMSCGINKSFFNPWFQALPAVLLMYSVGWFLPKWLAKLYFSFLVILSTLLTGISCFLLGVFTISLTPDVFYVLAASSLQESIEFIRIYFNWKIWLALSFSVVFLAALLYLVWKGPVKRSKATFVLVSVLLIPYLINVIRFTAKGNYARLYERNVELETLVAFVEYDTDLNGLITMTKNPKLPRNIKIHYSGKIVGILVIGESATRNHWGLYGYYRNTTPEMDKIRNDILVFDDVVSAFATTYASCRMMFSSAEYPSQRPLDYTVFPLLKAAGYKVFLISNQFRLGSFDGPVNILYSGLDRKEFMQEAFPGAKDGIMLDRLPKYIEETDGPVLIIVHLIGSHGSYDERYPAEFNKFGDEKDPGKKEFSEWNRRQINDYDNSILYTDHILVRIIEMLRKLPVPGYMLYLSDHGESPEISGSRTFFTTYLTCYEIPMIFYGNECYKQCFPDLMKAASENREKPYITDWMNYSIVSTAQVTHAGFPAEKDIFSAKYKGRENRDVGGKHIPYRHPRVKKPFYVDKHGKVKHLEKPNGN